MPRSVLYLAYFFPPRGGAGVQRSVKFAKYLPEFGWTPLVVANGGADADNASKVQDPTLMKDVPPGTVVRYTSLTDAERRGARRAQSRFWQRFCATDPMGWWCPAAVRAGLELARAHEPDAILVSMSPFTAAEAGMALKRRTGLPLVLDLRDPWALDETRIYPTRWHASRDWAAMARALSAADRVIMNTPHSAIAVAEEFGRQTQGLDDGTAAKVTWITNGYDAADFGATPVPPAPADVLRIVHTGTFHSEWATVWDDVLAGRGVINKFKYPRRPINLWARTPRYLLQAMERVTREGRIPTGKLELVLVGEQSPADRALVEGSGVAGMVRMLGYQKHADSVGWVESADVLFLPNHIPLDDGPTLIVPGKTYEYLGSGRPILAMSSPGDLRDFVTSTHSGVAIQGDDVGAAADALARFYQAKKEGRPVVTPDRAGIARFERRELTRRLAGVLDEVARPAKPLSRR